MITVVRYHDFSYGHRVVGHESKCRFLHGHNGRVHFHCSAPELDALGRVVDFGVIKSALCEWVEDNWDHMFLMWEMDPMWKMFDEESSFERGVIKVPFNPTAENMAAYLLHVIGPSRLSKVSTITLRKVVIEETRKCSAVAEL